MRGIGTIIGLSIGLAIGVVATMFVTSSPRSAGAASNDRYGEYVMATGAVSINPRIQTDGVWMLDYRSGKLLGTVIDKTQGKIVGWAEVDLTAEFNVKAFQDVHFMMTTGYVTQGQSALYVAETSTGKFGVYTMGPGTNGTGIVIRRHDQTSFRNVQPAEQPINAPAAAPVAGPVQGMPPPIVPPAPVPTTNVPLNPGTMPIGPLPTTPPTSVPQVKNNSIQIPQVPPTVNPPKLP